VKRRDFLSAFGGAVLLSPMLSARQPSATVLYDGRAIALDRVSGDPALPEALWIHKDDLSRVNGFELKPQGACRADLCVPVPPAMMRDAYFNLTGFAQRVGQRVVSVPDARVWSFGEIPVVRGSFLEGRMAPEFVVPDRRGRDVRLSEFRGKKVLVVTWASW
jgi:hypothetical protein